MWKSHVTHETSHETSQAQSVKHSHAMNTNSSLQWRLKWHFVPHFFLFCPLLVCRCYWTVNYFETCNSVLTTFMIVAIQLKPHHCNTLKNMICTIFQTFNNLKLSTVMKFKKESVVDEEIESYETWIWRGCSCRKI